jgi:single-stranded DNA-binding protein
MKLLKQNAPFKGTLLQHPELRYTAMGNPVTMLYILTDDGKPYTCEAWNDLAEAIIEKDLQPQSAIEIIGSIKIRSWDDRDGGNHKTEYVSIISIGA